MENCLIIIESSTAFENQWRWQNSQDNLKCFFFESICICIKICLAYISGLFQTVFPKEANVCVQFSGKHVCNTELLFICAYLSKVFRQFSSVKWKFRQLELLVTLLVINILLLRVFAFKGFFILDSNWMKFTVPWDWPFFRRECLLSRKRLISFMCKSGHKYACISSHLLCMIMNFSVTLLWPLFLGCCFLLFTCSYPYSVFIINEEVK